MIAVLSSINNNSENFFLFYKLSLSEITLTDSDKIEIWDERTVVLIFFFSDRISGSVAFLTSLTHLAIWFC